MQTETGKPTIDLKHIFSSSLFESAKSSLDIIKIMIPISFLMELLNNFGLLNILGDIAKPISGLLGLPGEAILAIITGYVISCYPAIAIITTLSLTIKQITIIGAMLVICHTLSVEIPIQKKIGGKQLNILLIRIISSLLVGMLLNLILKDNSELITGTNILPISHGWAGFLKYFALKNIIVLQIIILNFVILFTYRLLEALNVLALLATLLSPLMKIFGLPKDLTFLWLITNTAGLIYGSSLILSELKNSKIKARDLVKLNYSLATCHAIIQESAIFAVIGASIPALVAPRVLLAIGILFVINLREKVVISRKNVRLTAKQNTSFQSALEAWIKSKRRRS